MEDLESPGERQEVSQGEGMRFQELLEGREACVASGRGSVPSSGRGTIGLGSWSSGFKARDTWAALRAADPRTGESL